MLPESNDNIFVHTEFPAMNTREWNEFIWDIGIKDTLSNRIFHQITVGANVLLDRDKNQSPPHLGLNPLSVMIWVFYEETKGRKKRVVDMAS